jgi:hypothetical protein
VARDTDATEINRILREAATRGPLKGLLAYTELPHASCDFNHDPHSAIIDASQTRVSGPRLVNILAWFDNEWGLPIECWMSPITFCKASINNSKNRERLMTVLKMTDLDLQGKRVLIREDLNVPVKDGVVTSDARILASLPTIKLALEKGAAVMVCSHLGRPTEGEFSAENSLKPVADYLSKALGREVPLVAEYLDGVDVKAGDIVLFETRASTRARKRTPTSWRRNTPHCATSS